MKDPKKERGGVKPTAVPKTPALVKRGAAAMIAVGLVGCGPSQPAEEPQQPPQAVPPQAPPQQEEMTPPQEPPQAAPPPQAPPPQAPQR